MKRRIFYFTMISVALTSVMVFAAGKTYPSCKPEDYSPKKGEDFCPQLEGVTLPYCCPQPSLPALNCTYYKSKTVYSAQVRRGCSNAAAALIVNQIACVDSVQQDIVSTKLVFRGSSGTNGGSCCAQTCPPTRVLNGETLSLQTAQAPASCDSLSGYSSTEQAAKVAACKNESDPTACLGYASVCLAPPVIVAPPSDPSPAAPPSSPGPLPPVDPGGTPSTPVVTDPAPTTPPPPPIITPPPEVKHSRDSY